MSATTTTTNGAGAARATDPAGVVEAFLAAMEAGDVDAAVALLDDDIAYTNVSLPTIHGRRGVERLARLVFDRLGMHFRVVVHGIAVEGDVVLTERTDALGLGRFEQRFWVCGRFEVRDGRITVWRDYFDWADITVSLLRGALGAVVPALNRRWPSGG
ncbi:limonene-1,2-epoxide hydrolase family protein [Conexibacter sp. SYSU D00693]|uniref:limonene-1,2-epoxide hydrolase family protein n=1 Tax=Conexibacter sp. SYSU D00693 TaxID=2812560 RepID=UPI00196B4933|nr:limonene-1,2-epoxide hydrolase family protein [Conexibacter sp. SYSU D00693]